MKFEIGGSVSVGQMASASREKIKGYDVWHKTAITALLTHWRHHSIAQSHPKRESSDWTP